MSTEATQNPGVDKSDPLAGFSSLSSEDIITIDNSDEEPKKEEQKTEPAAEPENKNATQEPPKEEPKKEETSKEEPKKDVTEEKPKLGEGAEEESLKNPNEFKNEFSWVNAAKEIGFEIKDNSYDTFKTAKEEFLSKIKEEAKKEIEISSLKEQISDLPAETQLLVLGLKNGLNQEEINKPFKVIAEFKALDDADLVAKDFELKGYPQDLIDHKIEELTESGKLEIAAKELRLILDQNEASLLENKLQEVKKLDEENKRIYQEKIAKENEVISQTIDTLNQFMDAPISKKNKEYLAKRWESGAYHELAKDPKTIVEFMLWKEFGEQGITNLKNKHYERGRDERKMEQHNIPPVIPTGGASKQQTVNSDDPLAGFTLDFIQ